MALKKNEGKSSTHYNSIDKANEIFNKEGKNIKTKEKKILTTFSIEPSFKKELEVMFADMGLGWAAGIRFALKEFIKKYS